MAKCEAIKKDGERCKNNAKKGSRYCWMHEDYKADKLDIGGKKHKELIEKFEDGSKLMKRKLNEKIKNLENKIEESEEKSESRYKWNIIISIGGVIISFIAIIAGFFIAQHFFIEEVNTSRELAENTTIHSIKLSEEEYKRSLQLSEDSLNKTYWLTSPVILQVNHTVKYLNNSEGILEINVTNTHPLRETGAIYIYRLEINANKPHRIDTIGLRPNQSQVYDLMIKKKEKILRFNRYDISDMYYMYLSLDTDMPYDPKISLVSEHICIYYKIYCDNCPPQGFIRIFPGFDKPEPVIYWEQEVRIINGSIHKADFVSTNKIDTYEWADYKPEEVLQTNESIEILIGWEEMKEYYRSFYAGNNRINESMTQYNFFKS